MGQVKIETRDIGCNKSLNRQWIDVCDKIPHIHNPPKNKAPDKPKNTEQVFILCPLMATN